MQELGEGLTRISRELVWDISELRDVTQALKSQREQERNISDGSTNDSGGKTGFGWMSV